MGSAACARAYWSRPNGKPSGSGAAETKNMATLGVGGSTQQEQLARLGDRTSGSQPISLDEHQARVAKLTEQMRSAQIDMLYLNAGSGLAYFTGLRWYPSERMVGAWLSSDGELQFIAPYFEEGTVQERMVMQAPVRTWHEHESPYALSAQMVADAGHAGGRIALDASTPFFMSEALRDTVASAQLSSAESITQACRGLKSQAELDLLQRAKDMTLEVHEAAAKILRPGISTTEVTRFIHEAHRQVGAPGGSSFCIVLFGQASAFPHGVPYPQELQDGDMVLIDTGCTLHGYQSDITRSYVFGEPNELQRKVWNAEKSAQAAAFDAARPGATCASVDAAARVSLEADGFGPGYDLPGLPHRTGHGIGMDIHEGPYLVGSDSTPLAPGMCFSNEPMICVPGEFGVRLEDHFFITDDGASWFTQPSRSIDEPFLA